MRVKIGNKWHDSEKEPIVIELTDEDKRNIENMHPLMDKYCSYPNGTDRKEIENWMRLWER